MRHSQFTPSRFTESEPDEVTPSYPTHSARRYTETKSSEISSLMFTRSASSTSSDSDSVDAYPADFETVESDVNSISTFTPPASADVSSPARRTGAHRIPTPPSALKGRAAVLAVAAGAVVAAGQAVVDNGSGNAVGHSDVALADQSSTIGTTAQPQAAQFAPTAAASSTTATDAPQVLNVAAPTDLSQFSNLLAKGQRFSEERAAREAAARRPLFVLPAVGTFTSNFGSRWGTLHAGVDIAAPIGTPIVAVADGTVIDSGPASGFGMWVRLQHADGTITVYGHIDTSVVTVGQQVMAGDQIATVGNRGFSTGPHLHFEVHLAGENKIDPLPWLASRGISLGIEQD
ncbi:MULTISPECIES: M23 family metallopeptidase [Rhodococcus]|uniref:M23 family metallopeptidase n=1 Tax=Rhodococcus globerulus TaxID=33008 RepID=A0ABU4BPH9_RHOGO|nr:MULTISPECIES: M23 family metallopeptidase [Rhodococcus]MDV6266136.1 M23 family metallopeptidase [Rhodococcus globerulus]NRI64930.1 M23 family metallopeptidase [Rhodococcus sp. MS16]